MNRLSSPVNHGDEREYRSLSIVIVGPCAAGKSTLAQKLVECGFNARQIAQEHSYVPDMWLQLSKPDVLIFLEASFESCSQRKSLNWNIEDYKEQMRRLAHAHQNCDLCINTDRLDPDQILRQALDFLPKIQT